MPNHARTLAVLALSMFFFIKWIWELHAPSKSEYVFEFVARLAFQISKQPKATGK